jgi:FHS family L-fucose permease-like MFS transporter
VETSVQRLNLAQAFYPLGGLGGVLIGSWLAANHLALPTAGVTNSILHPYIVIGAGILVLAYLIGEARFPAVASERVKGLRSAVAELRTLAARPLFLFAVVAQFFSVLALAATWSLGDRFVASAIPALPRTALDDVFVLTLAVYGAGRFVGSALMVRIAPDRVLAVFACIAIVLAGIASLSGGPLGAIAVLASSFFLSIMWPTILGLAIQGTGRLMKLGTALICMGGAVGGFAYQMIAVTWTFPAVHFAMVLPLISYGVILVFARVSEKARRKSALSG